MRIKRLLVLFVGIALIVFFTLPSLLFGDNANTTTVDQDPVDDWVVSDDTRHDGDGFEVQENDPAVFPADPNDGEIMDVYCLDWIPDGTQGNGIHIGDNYDEANPPENHVEDLVGNNNWVTDNFEEDPLPNPDEYDILTDEMSEDAIEILSSVATGGTEVEDQLAVWSYTDNFNENDDANSATIEDAVSRIVEANRDLDATNDVNISTLNSIDITLEGGAVTLNSSGQDTTGKEITVTMEDPLVPGMTDDGKTVTLYILGGSINVSFNSSSLVTDITTIMNDVVSGIDHDGIASSTYYYYYWGAGYDPSAMNAVIGGWVDIDGDGLLDTNVPDPNTVISGINIVDETDPSITYQLSTSDVDNTTVPGGTILIPMELSGQEWVYNSSNQRLAVKAYDEPITSEQQSHLVVFPYDVSFDKDFEGTPPENAEFDIYADDGTGNPTGLSLGHDSLGVDGSVDFTNLPPGNYVIVETYTPPGYSTMGYILITITQDGNISGLPEIPVENNMEEEERYDISFDKVFGGMDEGEAIPGGAQFTIFDSSGTVALTFPGITGANPVTINNNGDTVTFSGVVPGTYVIKETSTPPGYETISPITVTLDGSGSISGLPEVVRNDPKEESKGSITVIKKDESGALLDGVGFTLYYKDSGNPVMPEQFTSGGLVTFSGLAFGTYILKETTPLAGYDTSDPVEITIDASNAEAGVTITRIDTKTPPRKTPPPPGGGEIQVLGIQELPFTGMNPFIPISGASAIFAGGLMVMLSSIRRKLRRK